MSKKKTNDNLILEIIKNKQLPFHQKIIALARAAENNCAPLKISAPARSMMKAGFFDDLFEGAAPYRPRYTMPDYALFLKQGSSFLDLPPAHDLLSAINHLLIIYRHVPSITTYPVYLGNLDTLLEPFLTSDDEFNFKVIKNFLLHLDRTITDSFVHANIGPTATRCGRLILRAEKELKNAVPNLTLKYDEKITPDDFALAAIATGLVASKPSFANHHLYTADFGQGDHYGLASCYNALPIGGGSYTLTRMNLKLVAEKSKGNFENFLQKILPDVAQTQLAYSDERIRFLCTEADFFHSNFLVKEGLLAAEKFICMFGIYGLAEATEFFSKEKYGHSPLSQEYALRILGRLQEIVNAHHHPFTRYLLHAQSGISSDHGVTPGARIPVGQEPELLEHLLYLSPIHPFFPTGASEIISFDQTAEKNPAAILQIIKGAMSSHLRMFAFYSAHSDLIRITGYLVKKSEIAKHEKKEQVLHDTVELGREAVQKQKLMDRKIQK